MRVYNYERPHQALGGAYPADVYTPSSRIYEPPAEPDYPFHDRTVRVTRCGLICLGNRKINLSTVFAGELVGIREVEDRIWLVSFLHDDLGYFDHEEGRMEPGPNPFRGKSVNYVPGIDCKPCLQNGPVLLGGEGVRHVRATSVLSKCTKVHLTY